MSGGGYNGIRIPGFEVSGEGIKMPGLEVSGEGIKMPGLEVSGEGIKMIKLDGTGTDVAVTVLIVGGCLACLFPRHTKKIIGAGLILIGFHYFMS